MVDAKRFQHEPSSGDLSANEHGQIIADRFSGREQRRSAGAHDPQEQITGDRVVRPVEAAPKLEADLVSNTSRRVIVDVDDTKHPSSSAVDTCAVLLEFTPSESAPKNDRALLSQLLHSMN